MSFLQDYALYAKGNEAHPTYHVYAALVALSSFASRKVWIKQGYFDVYPNIYVVLVGPPGSRKSTAMSICKKLLRKVEDIPFSAECQTKESLVKELATYSRSYQNPEDNSLVVYTPITVCVTELSQFLGASNAHMIDFLTTIYDLEIYDAKTKNKGMETIMGPYVTLLACTTPSWITARLRDDVISGGFSRRALFVYETERSSRITFPEVLPEAQAAWERLTEYGKKLKDIHGPFSWTKAAIEFYDNWYQTLKIPDDPTTSGYFETKQMQLLKISMLVSLSERLDLVLEQNHIETGLSLLSLVERNLSKVFEGIGRNELNSIATKILELLQQSGPLIPEKKIYSIMYREASTDELMKILMHLEKTDRIERYRQEKPNEPVRYYIKLKGVEIPATATATATVPTSPTSQPQTPPLV